MNLRKTLFLIPCKNESGRIGKVIHDLKQINPDLDILVLNDHSTDHSVAEAQENGARILSFDTAIGYGPVIVKGFEYALRNRYQCVVIMDGDGQHQAKDALGILQYYEDHHCETDIVIGSRYLHFSSWSLRFAGARVLSIILRCLTGQSLTDPTSGLQCLGEKSLNLFCRKGRRSVYRDIDIWYLCHLAGFKVTEIPVSLLKRTGGQSMHRGIQVVNYFLMLPLSLYTIRKEWNHPLPKNTASIGL